MQNGVAFPCFWRVITLNFETKIVNFKLKAVYLRRKFKKQMKIALIGYGKMGHMIEEIAKKRGHEIVSIIDIDNLEDFDSPAFCSADVAIEFTAPHVAYDNYLRAFAHHVKVVSGSTGWLKEHGEDVKRMCEEQGQTLFWSSNFSLGVTVFRAVNRYLARIMNQFPTYDVSMTETHHIHKLDAPSGTAISLAEDVVSNLDRVEGWKLERTIFVAGDKPDVVANASIAPDQMPIVALREGEVPGIHTVRYDSEADYIEIKHSANSRRGFALGVVLAAEFTNGKKGFFGMKDMLGF